MVYIYSFIYSLLEQGLCSLLCLSVLPSSEGLLMLLLAALLSDWMKNQPVPQMRNSFKTRH